MLRLGLAFLALILAVPAAAQQAPHHAQARDIFARLISFRSAEGQGQVVPMANYIAEILRAGGVPAEDIVMLPSGETTGMLVRVQGRDRAARPILFSAHMDVVDARPEDWTRNPFELFEENGFFFGRGTRDNKAGVAAMVSTILRMRSERHQPRRTLVFAFVGDEETTFDTTRLIAAHPWVRNAEYAINTDAGGGLLSEEGRPLIYAVQGAEKTYATFEVRATNPGGHSSRPRDDNAIYELARALLRIEAHRFPVMHNSLTRSFFAAVGATMPGEAGEPLRRFAANPDDEAAAEALRRRPEFVGVTRTTCVATMLNAGHAENALPQRAVGTVNCRIFPGVSVESVRATLGEAVADPALEVAVIGNPEIGPVSEPRADVMAAIARDVRRIHAGVPITPNQESGATDGLIYRQAGIPTWGSSGIFMRASDVFAHGLNERVPVAAFYQGVDHIYALARDLGGR